jgi:hypothetical protein
VRAFSYAKCSTFLAIESFFKATLFFQNQIKSWGTFVFEKKLVRLFYLLTAGVMHNYHAGQLFFGAIGVYNFESRGMRSHQF